MESLIAIYNRSSWLPYIPSPTPQVSEGREELLLTLNAVVDMTRPRMRTAETVLGSHLSWKGAALPSTEAFT